MGEHYTLIGCLAVAVTALAAAVKYLFGLYQAAMSARIQELKKQVDEDEKSDP